MKIRIIFFFSLILSSCIKDKYTNFTGDLQNKTMHKIKIYPYKNGVVQEKDTITLLKNSVFNIAKGTLMGIVESPGFESDYFGGPNDSVIVIFDDIYRITHYANNPNFFSDRHYLFTSTRNILNPKSYEFIRIKGEKNVFTNMHVYTFSEQDYLDAKK